MADRRGRDRGRDGDEQQADDQLDQRLEERQAGGDVKAAQVGRREAHDDRGDQPRIVAEHVTGRGHGDHTGQLGRGSENLAEPERAQHAGEQRDTDGAAGRANGDAGQELAELGAVTEAGARHNAVENDRPEDGADGIDQRAFPRQDPLDPLTGPDEGEQRAHHRGPGDDQNGPGHQRRLLRHAQQHQRHAGGERNRDRDAEGDQPPDHAARVPRQLPQLESEARVVEDHGDRERDHRLEGRSQQLVGIDIAGQRARGEANGEQDDQRGDPQAAREHLGSDRERSDQAQADEGLIRGHR